MKLERIVFLCAFLSAACSGVTVGPGATNSVYGEQSFVIEDPGGGEPSGPPTGHWTGTITFHGTIEHSTHDSGDNGQDPNSSYYSTFDKTESQTADATDTFTIDGTDSGDLTYGLHRADLGGSAANQGSSDYHSVTTGHARDSSCQWDYEEHKDHVGSWSGSGRAEGEISFSEDGGYHIDIRADRTGADGYEPDSVTFPFKTTTTASNVTGGCQQNGDPDSSLEVAPPIEWVSSHGSDADVNGTYVVIKGQLNNANPGSVVDGTSTWNMNVPEGFTITITWHLVHDGPIVLPHS